MSVKDINNNINNENIEQIQKTEKKMTESSPVIIINPNSSEQKQYGEIPYRWFFLIAYCLTIFADGFQWPTFSAISSDFSKNYDIPMWKVNMFSLIYMIEYPFVCIPEGYLFDNYSTRLGIILASLTTSIGSLFKLFINKKHGLTLCYIGQSLSGLFHPALLNSPGKLSANWFREDIRTTICTICCLADNFGIFVGFLWNLLFVDEEASKEKYKDQIFKYLLSEFILNIVFCIPAFFIWKSKPEIPPSPSQEKNEEYDIITSLKMLFKNKRFVYLLISTLFVVGYYSIMGTIINALLDLYLITTEQSDIIYAVSSIISMIASVIISWLLDKYKKFKLFMIILCLLGTIFQALFTFLLELAKSKDFSAYAISLVFYTLVNIVVVPFYTIGMNYACEITYPVGESINGAIMMTMSQISGIGGSFLCDYFISNYENKPWISNVILLGFFAVSCIFVFLFEEKLDRQEVDLNGNMKYIKNNDENKKEVENIDVNPK